MKRKWRVAGLIGLMTALIVAGGSLWVLGRAFRREQATHDLAVAVYANNTSAALAALHAGADPNTRQRPTDNPPTISQFVQQLWRQMRGGKGREQAEADHRPPMIALAAAKKNRAVVQVLLDNGAIVDAHARYEGEYDYDYAQSDETEGATALMWAVDHDDIGMVRVLLNKGADLDFDDTFRGQAPLLHTANPTMMEILLTHGANVHCQIKHYKFTGMTPLMDIVKGFFSVYDMDIEDRRKAHQCIELLLAHGADINEHGGCSETPLMIAAQYGAAGDVRYLLKLGADPNLSVDGNDTALMSAIDDGKTENIKVLLAHGANPNVRNRDGETALFWAVRYGHDEPVRLLLRGGARVNVKNKAGKTPLQLAEEDEDGRGNDSVEEILRAAGARDY